MTAAEEYERDRAQMYADPGKLIAPPPELPPAHHCRDELIVRDWQGSSIARYIWMCDGTAIKLTAEVFPAGAPNGFYLADWRMMTEDLMTYVVPRPRDRAHLAYRALGTGPDHRYHDIQLGPVVNADELAGLLGALPADMREVLAKFAPVVPRGAL